MHIENVTINVSLPHPRAAASDFLASLLSTVQLPDAADEETSTPKMAASDKPPKIGEVWPGQGGIYAGVTRGEDGAPDCHLVLSIEKPQRELAWQEAVDWATEVRSDGHEDFHAPTRFESALLYANLRDHLDTNKWHWTSTQSSDFNAWGQDFNDGGQYGTSKEFEAAVRAVRRFSV
jgi:hypothetical protein